MVAFDDLKNSIIGSLEAKLMTDDLDHWYSCLDSVDKYSYVPLQFKPGFIQYQEAYFKDVYTDYQDISMVLYRGGRPVGIWSICVYRKDRMVFSGLPKKQKLNEL